MARLHSKKKGKSGRKRSKDKVAPAWVDLPAQEIKDLILQMSKEGMPSAKIGLLLRDRYGVPRVRPIIGMTINHFLKQEGKLPQYPEDLLNLIRKAVGLRTHLKTNRKDNHNKVKLSHIEFKIHRLVKYYTRTGRLPAQWRYDSEKASLLVK